MAIDLGAAHVDIVPSTGNLAAEVRRSLEGPLRQAGQTAGREFSNGFGGAITSVARSAGRTLVDGMAAAGQSVIRGVEGIATVSAGILATSLVTGFGRFTALENADKMLEQMGLTAEQSETLMGALNDTLTGTAFALDTGAAAVANFVSAGADLEQIPGLIDMITDSAAFGNAELSEVAGIWQRILLQGRATNMELQMLTTRNIPAYSLLAEALGITEAAVRDLASDGELSAEIFFEAWAEGAEGFGENSIRMVGAAQSMGDTTQGALANMRTALARFGANAFAPVFEAIRPVADGIRLALNEIAPSAAEAVAGFTDSGPFRSFIEFFETVPDRIGPGIDKLRELGPALVPIAAGFAALGASGIARALGPFGAIIPTINPLVAAFAAFVVTNDELREAFGGLGEALLDFGRRVGEALAPVGQSVLPVFVDALVTVVDFIADRFLPTFAGLIEDGLEALSGWWDRNGETVIGFFDALGTVMREVVLPPLGWIGDILWDHVLPAFGWFIDNEEPLIGVLTALSVVISTKLVIAVLAYAAAMAKAAVATVLATWPLLLAAVLVGALTVAVWKAYENWGWFKGAVDDVIDQFRHFGKAIEPVLRVLRILIDLLKEALDLAARVNEVVSETIAEAPGRGLNALDPRTWGDQLRAFKFKIPGFATGGLVPGSAGQAVPAIVHGGEMVFTQRHQADLWDAINSGALAGESGSPLIAGDLVVQQLPGEDAGQAVFRNLRKLEAVL